MPTFKEFQLYQGLNLILADKSPGATERQTRNGAGKSSLTELIHFLMGANLFNSSIFRAPTLIQYFFGIDFDLGQTKTRVERSGDASSKVIIRGANTRSWLFELIKDKLFESESEVISNSQWRTVLGNLMFGLKEVDEGTQTSKFGAIVGSSAELRTRLTLTEERSRQLRKHVSSFQVIPEYRNLENEASQLTREMGTLADENTIDRQLLSELQEAFSYEVDPSVNDLTRLYQEAGVILSESVVRRFEDVKQFHESIIENRKSYLNSEVIAADRRIKSREEQMITKNNRLATIMAILQSHGALDQFVKLQSELTAQEAKTEAIRQQFAAVQQLEGQKSELEFERRQLELRLRQDYHEQEETLRHAILVFEKFSSALYEEAGNLTIDASTNGPRFDVTIRGEKSKGISNMQIFCFDMMLMQICAERHIGPGFLVHDSHLFDGVDERQVAKALQLGERAARDLKFQYIVTMNSDAVPRELPDDFDLNKYILPVRLTDATEEGGLFGVRF